MKSISTALTALLMGAAFASPVVAQDHSNHGSAANTSAAAAPAPDAAAVMTAGEITRVDTRTGKLTIRHEEIKNLDMPPMTMVFGLKDAAQAAQFKPGDKVRFHVEDNNGALTITRIEAAQ